MRPRPPGLLVFVVAAVLVGAAAIPAQAARRIKEFALPSYNSYPNHITAGPDGALWFTELGGAIGRITTEGTFTEYSVPTPNSAPNAITSGPDGNLWFTEYGAHKIGRITPDGVFAEYTVPTNDSSPWGITAGPDGKPVVHRRARQQDRADNDPRACHRVHRPYAGQLADGHHVRPRRQSVVHGVGR